MTHNDKNARLLTELAQYWHARVRQVPALVFRMPSLADDFVGPRLIALRSALAPDEYASISETIYAIATGATLESRRAASEAAERLANERASRMAVQGARLIEELRRNFLGVDLSFLRNVAPEDDGAELAAIRSRWITEWCETSLGIGIDQEQATAIGAHQEHVLVAARAGSGKTRTLVARTAFLMKQCGVAPHEVLLLAFNREAAQQIRERISALGCEAPFVMTFHALAYAIVRPMEDMLKNDSTDGTGPLRRVVEWSIQDLLADPDSYRVVRDVMLIHFTSDWLRLERGHFSQSPEVALAQLRSLRMETLGGEFVKSHGEQVIANFLFEHNLPYNYEQARDWYGPYRPDFTISVQQKRLVIEYFGMTGDETYDNVTEAKRRYWNQQSETEFLELTPKNLRGGAKVLAEYLSDWFRSKGVKCERLSEGEIWNRIRDRAITRFGNLTQAFISRCRQLRYTPSDVRGLIAKAEPGPEQSFYSLMPTVLERYLQRLAEEKQEDFSGLVARAIDAIAGGTTGFLRDKTQGDLSRVRFLMVDEFQDFSPLFLALTQGILAAAPKAQLLAVGDDWQAINGFAGASTRYFTGFADHFRPTQRLDVTTNYRSASAIVESSNRLMVGAGLPARANKQDAGQVLLGNLAEFRPTPLEEQNSSPLTAAMRRLVSAALARGSSVAVLSRTNLAGGTIGTNAMPDLDECRRVWTEGLSAKDKARVSVTTVHSFKGREADVVIIHDADVSRYPLLHPDWRYSRLFGDDLEQVIQAERQLFYVACTRASDTLFILTSGEPSPFVPLLGDRVRRLRWDDCPPPTTDATSWIVRVYNRAGSGPKSTIEIKDLLKAEQFAYRGGKPSYWEATSSRNGENIENAVAILARQSWSLQGKQLEVNLYDAALQLHGSFNVNMGTWQVKPVR